MLELARDKRQIPDDEAPQTPAEFWDTNRYKGKRSLYSGLSGGGTLQIALLADGVRLNELYPLDLDQALRSLERLGRRHHMGQHQCGADPTAQFRRRSTSQLFQRVVAANRSGGQLRYTPGSSGGMGNPYCVMQSSANKKEAFEYISYMLNTPKVEHSQGGRGIYGADKLCRAQYRSFEAGFP